MTSDHRLRSHRAGAAVLAAVLLITALVGGSPSASAATAAAPTPVLGKKIIGYSVQHRPIVAYHLGNPKARPASLIIGQIHGDEHAGAVVAKSLLNGSQRVLGINLWVIPTMNPDGDHAHTRQNAHRVDLNRNWPSHWRHLTGQYYSGRKPLSEPETRAVSAFLTQLHPRYLLVLHQPLDGVDTSTAGGAAGRALVNRLARNLHLAKKSFTCWSVCYGSLASWYNKHKLGIPETVEFGWHPSHRYLVGTVRRGLIAALRGRLGPLTG